MSDIERYIHAQIPITAAMGVSVVQADTDRVQLSAPLQPNINHRETVFGGSAAAVATLAAWTLVLLRLRAARLSTRLVISQNSMTYDRPITADFEALAVAEDLDSWDRFTSGIRRKGRGRVTAASTLWLDGQQMAGFEGRFVALALPGNL
ncbi:MAG: thioesterase domain-containing protein [Planctomycetaceae bacterium]|nr:thioesterase domain-containing protein [Planctomycetaceae bacterium]